MKLSAVKSMLALFSVMSTITGSNCLPPPRVLDVYVPSVIRPHANDTWVIGQNREVVWDVSSPPKQITNPYGVIKLRKGGFTLDNVILASKFNITDGSAQIIVPNVPEGDDYCIVLFGDSGNFSPAFSIVKGPY